MVNIMRCVGVSIAAALFIIVGISASDMGAGNAMNNTSVIPMEEGQCGMVEHSNGGGFLSKDDDDTKKGQCERGSRISKGCVQLEWPIQEGIIEMFSTLSLSDIPSSMDWRKKGAVSQVKNQGPHCDSGWAFSVVGAIEAIEQIKRFRLYQLSAQELVDCDKRNKGCCKGFQNIAFQYIISMKGLKLEREYPYEGKVGHCRSTRERRFSQIDDYRRVPDNEKDLQIAVARQPITAIVALGEEFGSYEGGVFKGPCVVVFDPLDPVESLKKNDWHAILVVGYGKSEEDGSPYWLIKNSWGVNWGEEGFMRMKMGDTSSPWGLCGIALQAYYPIIN